MSTILEIADTLIEMAAELKAGDRPKTVAACCDTIKRQAAELANVKAQLANVNSLAISRGRENEQLRAKLDASVAQANHWWQLAHEDKLKVAERDEVITELRKEIKRLQSKPSLREALDRGQWP